MYWVGHCSMIGSQTGKIVGYSVRNKFCRQCDNATERNQLPPPHNCKRNWTGIYDSLNSAIFLSILIAQGWIKNFFSGEEGVSNHFTLI